MDGVFVGYRAWYQMIPGNSTPMIISDPKPGDTIRAIVDTTTGSRSYTLTVDDLTHPALGFSKTTKCEKGVACKNSSAEVTAGSPGPGSWGGYPAGTPPADFGTIKFTKILVVGSGASSGLKDPGFWTTDQIIQTGPPPVTVANPLGGVGGVTFTDTW